jgi:hypothetical protein
MTIADLQLLSTVPQQQRQLVCCQGWPSFATLPTDCYWGVNATVHYGGCILIPLRSVGHWSFVGWSTMRVPGLWKFPSKRTIDVRNLVAKIRKSNIIELL